MMSGSAAVAAVVAAAAYAARQRARAVRAAAATEAVYRERAHLTALVARLLAQIPDAEPVVIAYNSSCPPTDWPAIYIELPGAGQISYHINPADLPVFGHVATVAPHDRRARWDGTGKATTHHRIRRYVATTGRARVETG
ncbi:hypothetical protein ACWDO0_27930 [Nocardia rhamnosiphila]